MAFRPLDVIELVRAVAITPLPDARPLHRGRRERARPHSARAGHPRSLPAARQALDPCDHFIVASTGSRGVILRVDRATHLALVDEASVQRPETLGPSATYVAGVARLDDGLVLIHDLTTFLSAAEAASLEEALSAGPP
jgi:purine-binding chemotaxis protein CheW